jgi:hypothetical protein
VCSELTLQLCLPRLLLLAKALNQFRLDPLPLLVIRIRIICNPIPRLLVSFIRSNPRQTEAAMVLFF